MKIYNSSNRSTAELQKIVEFVADRCEAPYMAHLIVGHNVEHKYTDGHASQRAGSDPTAPSRVSVCFGSQQYPLTTIHVKEVGPITVRTWQEDFLFVLAHELRHIDQFWDTDGDPDDIEADAEIFAMKILLAWREKKDEGRNRRVHGAQAKQARRVQAQPSARVCA